MRLRVTAVRQYETPIVSLLDDALPDDARERVLDAIRLLESACPRVARRFRRQFRRVRIAKVRSQPITIGRRYILFGDRYVLGMPADGLALLLIYATAWRRLAKFVGRRASADRRAQVCRRLYREVANVAAVFDEREDPSGYVPGVSTGRLEEWTNAWLSNAVLRPRPRRGWAFRWARDARRLGIPRWIVRPMTAFKIWYESR